MNDYFNRSIEDSISALKTNATTGLNTSEAERSLSEFGENKLEGKKEKSMFKMFLDQFKDFLVIILIVAAVISMALGELVDGSIILLIVMLNAILGVTQENKASNALKALKELSSPLAKVIRNGTLERIASNLVCVGDIVVLEAGDYIPADLRLIESINMKVDESALTGESVPVEKDAKKILPDDASLGDRINSAYMGTIVTYGRGKGVVVHTGMKTQMGKIAAMLSDTVEEATPLQKKLNQLGKILGIICLAVCALIFGLGMWQGMEMFEIFMISVSLAVAAIPEGLTVVVTVILAMGMQKMVKVHAIIKRLSAVETLGSTTVICSDKTGTLTQNKMTVVKLYDGKNFYEVSGTGYGAIGEVLLDGKIVNENSGVQKILEGATLCNDATYQKAEEKIIGDPTEGALLVVAEKFGISCTGIHAEHERVAEIPFDSGRKLMSTFHNINGITMYIKGAPDEILRRSSFIYQNGEIIPISEDQKKAIAEANEGYAKNALRVLGVAFKETETIASTESDIAERDLVFAGLLGMIDPPRTEVADAIAICKRASIGVKMITGDHKITASAIAAQIGITSDMPAIEGLEINQMDETELRERVKHTSVFARVSPEHKVRLVDAIKANGNIVAMTGDGVNDAPSLKRADIGIAMGITGTDVSKEAADMILTDDNFASIVKAVEEGRTIYNNIRKVVAYLLSCNIGEILVIFVAMLMRLPVPLAAIHLLSINLITDAFPAFALGMEPEEEGVMDEAPRNPAEPIINKRMSIAIGIQSIALAIGTLGSFIVGFNNFGSVLDADGKPIIAVTMCYFTLVLGELLRSYAARSEHKTLFSMNPFANSFLNKCVIASVIFLFATVYVGFMQDIFSTIALTLPQLGIAAAFSMLPFFATELAKIVTNKVTK